MQPLDGADIVDTLPLGPAGPRGEPGPRGNPGPQGIPGRVGLTGPIGISTYSGSTTPDSGFGRDGDAFLLVTNGNVLRKIGGAWTVVGNFHGDKGDVPGHQVVGQQIRFQNPDGTWGDLIDLTQATQASQDAADRAEAAADRAESYGNVPVLAPKIASPANGAVATLIGGGLTLSVAAFRPLYPKTQKSIRFQIATTAGGFGSPLYDSGAVTGASLSATVANATSLLSAGTYYLRASQTDEDDFTSAWSPVTSFVIPNSPYAPTMSAPANNATGVGAQNQSITLTASAYSHPQGAAQSARRFELSKDNFATIVTVNGTVGQASATLTNPKGALTANTVYKVRCVDTDTNGAVATGASTSFTTATVFRTNPGEPDSGGFKGFNDFGDGLLYDLIMAAKSTEGSKQFNTVTNDGPNGLSRLNGPQNTAVGTSSTATAAGYAKSIMIGGVAGHLPAIDEARAISSKLKSSVAPVVAFQAGGAEVFSNEGHWSSTEISASAAAQIAMQTSGAGAEYNPTKTATALVRAIRRVAVTPPYPIGTYLASEGGYLAAYFTDLSSGTPITYMLIVADKATEVSRAFDTGSGGLNGKLARTNGNLNAQASAQFAAWAYCDALSSGGQTDWYLGAIDEMLAVARLSASLPSAQQISLSDPLTSSTEADANNARFVHQSAGEATYAKNFAKIVRPIRRVLLPA